MKKIILVTALLFIYSIDTLACDSKSKCEKCACKEESKELWKKNISLGFNKTSGNSDVLGINAGFLVETEQEKNIFLAKANTFYSEQEDPTTEVKGTNVNKSLGLIQYNRLLSERLYTGIGINFLRDEVADLKYRVTPAPVIGYYWIKSEDFDLSTEAGPAFVLEKVQDTKDEYLSPYFGQKLKYKLSDKSSLFQTAQVFLDANNSDNYLIASEVGIQADLIDNVSLILALQDNYDNVPASGREKNDFIIVNSLGVSF